MLVCNYCGRNLKNNYDTCPGCGSNSFSENATLGEFIIKTPPKDGYHVNLDSYKKSKLFANIFKWLGIGTVIVTIMFFIPFFIIPFLMTGIPMEGEEDIISFNIPWILITSVMFFISIIIPILFIIIGKISKKKSEKEMERIEKLSKKGILIKNLPYEKEPTGTIINGKPVYALKVYYENGKGNKMPLISNAKYNEKVDNLSGTADLLIDPDDISNYYIDLEIY